MRFSSYVVLAAVILLAVVLVTQNGAKLRTVHAQSGCDVTSLNGAYGYNLNGYAYDNAGNLYLIASSGRLVADGNGGVTGADTYSFDGSIGKRT